VGQSFLTEVHRDVARIRLAGSTMSGRIPNGRKDYLLLFMQGKSIRKKELSVAPRCLRA